MAWIDKYAEHHVMTVQFTYHAYHNIIVCHISTVIKLAVMTRLYRVLAYTD